MLTDKKPHTYAFIYINSHIHMHVQIYTSTLLESTHTHTCTVKSRRCSDAHNCTATRTHATVHSGENVRETVRVKQTGRHALSHTCAQSHKYASPPTSSSSSFQTQLSSYSTATIIRPLHSSLHHLLPYSLSHTHGCKHTSNRSRLTCARLAHTLVFQKKESPASCPTPPHLALLFPFTL